VCRRVDKLYINGSSKGRGGVKEQINRRVISYSFLLVEAVYGLVVLVMV